MVQMMQTKSDTVNGVEKIMQPTSVMAKLSVDAMSIQQKILCHLMVCDSTDDELEQRMEMRHQTVSSCRRGCVVKEWVQATGITRKTSSGRLANVWELTGAGKLDRILA